MALIDINWNPSKKELRQFAGLVLLFFGVFGAVVYHKSGSLESAAWIWVPAVLVGTLGLAAPRAIRYIYVGWICAAFPIGWVVSHLLLGFVFYFVLTPCGLLLRAFGHDPMHRAFDPKAKTYWVERPQREGVEHYFRQF